MRKMTFTSERPRIGVGRKIRLADIERVVRRFGGFCSGPSPIRHIDPPRMSQILAKAPAINVRARRNPCFYEMELQKRRRMELKSRQRAYERVRRLREAWKR